MAEGIALNPSVGRSRLSLLQAQRRGRPSDQRSRRCARGFPQCCPPLRWRTCPVEFVEKRVGPGVLYTFC